VKRSIRHRRARATSPGLRRVLQEARGAGATRVELGSHPVVYRPASGRWQAALVKVGSFGDHYLTQWDWSPISGAHATDIEFAIRRAW
jgi:hypothetical protein